MYIYIYIYIYYICLKSISTFFSDLRGFLWRLWRILKLKNEEVRICSKNSETRYITSVDRYYPLWRSTTAQNRPNLFFVIRLVHKLQNYSWLTLYQVFMVFKPFFRVRCFFPINLFRSFIVWREDQDLFRVLYLKSNISYSIYLYNSCDSKSSNARSRQYS